MSEHDNTADYHADRASRMLEIVGRHRPGRRRRRLLLEATRERRLASEAISAEHEPDSETGELQRRIS